MRDAQFPFGANIKCLSLVCKPRHGKLIIKRPAVLTDADIGRTIQVPVVIFHDIPPDISRLAVAVKPLFSEPPLQMALITAPVWSVLAPKKTTGPPQTLIS
jgi:hypothetical protein